MLRAEMGQWEVRVAGIVELLLYLQDRGGDGAKFVIVFCDKYCIVVAMQSKQKHTMVEMQEVWCY